MNPEPILDAFRAKVFRGEEKREVCYTCLSPFPNFLPELQDCLENAGISAGDFVAADPRFFVVERGRLRIRMDETGRPFNLCVSFPAIRIILKKL